MSTDGDATLFPAVAGADGDPFLLVTNRYNLLEFLSAGYLMPYQGFSKYYADLLAIAPGRLPLMRRPVDPSVVDAVMAEDATAFPVALELRQDLDASGNVPALDSDGSVTDAGLADPVSVLAPDGVIPLAWVRTVHFRTQQELDEHLAREYENIRADAVSYSVTPQLFGATGIDLVALTSFLTALPPSPLTAGDLEDLDRLAGARGAILAAAPAIPGALRAVTALIADDPPGTEEFPRWLSAALLSNGKPDTSADGHLFATAVEVLRQEDRSAAWRPLAVLDRIEQALSTRKLAKKAATEIEKNLRPIRSILRNERDFKAFDAASGLSAAKALLLVFLRPDAERVVSWDRSETGATTVEYAGAAALAGFLRGHKRASLELRTVGADQFLAHKAAVAFSRVAADPLVPAEIGAADVVEEAGISGALTLRVRWGGQLMLEKVCQPPSAAERLAAADLSSGKGRRAAIKVCRHLGWNDCARTVITAERFAVAHDAQTKSMRVVVEGLPELAVEVDEARFRERLSTDLMPAELAAEVVSMLTASE